MNTQGNHHNSASVDVLGKLIASRLSDGTDDLPHEITERLKVARAQAVARRRIVSAQTQLSVSGGVAALQLGGEEDGLWNRIASFFPLIALGSTNTSCNGMTVSNAAIACLSCWISSGNSRKVFSFFSNRPRR